MQLSWLRHCERLLIVSGGILSVVLGFLLFRSGIDKGDVSFSWGKFVVSGQGPGIVLIAGGILVFIWALSTQMRISQRQGQDEQITILGRPEPPPDLEEPK